MEEPMKEKRETPHEVLVTISTPEHESSSTAISPASSSPTLKPTIELGSLSSTSQMASHSPCPTPGRPPRNPADALTRRKTIKTSSFSNPKSRFSEPAYPTDSDLELVDNKKPKDLNNSPYRMSPAASPRNTPTVSSPKDNLKSIPITPRTPLIVAEAADDEDDDEVYQTANLKVQEMSGKKKKFKLSLLLEWSIFVCLTGVLVASKTVDKLEEKKIWGLDLWKWSVLVLVIFSGRLVTGWLINILVFLIEMNYLLKKKVLYFVYGLKATVKAFIWIALILLAWGLLISRGVERSGTATKILNHITRAIASCLIGAGLWLIKTLLIKMLASSFQCTRFFDRIQESIFHQYVVRTLSGPPLMEMAENIGQSKGPSGHLSFRQLKGTENSKEEVIDVEKLHKMKQEKISAWTMKGLIGVVNGSGLSTLSSTLDVDEEDEEQKDKEITNEWEAKAAAYRIFKNVAKPGHKHIDEEDLLRFIKHEEVNDVIALFEGAAESRKIKRSVLKNWLVNVYVERKSLKHALNDTKTAIEELNRLASGVLIVIIVVVWLLLMGLLNTKVLVFISSQLLLLGFMFGNTAKTVFEAIIFVFVMHPYDVGDRCVVDGIQMIVEEVNILNTVFLRYDNEKIFYPNSVLSTKPISNFYRSPEMGDNVEFTVGFSTTADSIASLKAKVKSYIEGKSQHFRPNHSIIIKEIENVNKLKLALYFTHTINFQNYGDKTSRRSDLIWELRRIFEELNIEYHLLSQTVVLSNATSVTWSRLCQEPNSRPCNYGCKRRLLLHQIRVCVFSSRFGALRLKSSSRT